MGIDVIKTKLVRAKIAQGDNMVHVSSTMHRTFGPGDWQQLHQLLTQWKSNIHTVKEQMQHVASAQRSQIVEGRNMSISQKYKYFDRKRRGRSWLLSVLFCPCCDLF